MADYSSTQDGSALVMEPNISSIATDTGVQLTAYTRYLFDPGECCNLRYVHPVKREKLRCLLESDIPAYVERIYLFGSCLDLSCRTESDIDLYFITDAEPTEVSNDLHKLCRVMQNPFDLLINSYEEFIDNAQSINSVEFKIRNEGLLLYEKEKD